MGGRLRKKIPHSKEKMWGYFEKRAAGLYTTPWGVCLYRRGRPVCGPLFGAEFGAVFIRRPAWRRANYILDHMIYAAHAAKSNKIKQYIGKPPFIYFSF